MAGVDKNDVVDQSNIDDNKINNDEIYALPSGLDIFTDFKENKSINRNDDNTETCLFLQSTNEHFRLIQNPVLFCSVQDLLVI